MTSSMSVHAGAGYLVITATSAQLSQASVKNANLSLILSRIFCRFAFVPQIQNKPPLELVFPVTLIRKGDLEYDAQPDSIPQGLELVLRMM